MGFDRMGVCIIDRILVMLLIGFDGIDLVINGLTRDIDGI